MPDPTRSVKVLAALIMSTHRPTSESGTPAAAAHFATGMRLSA
jgi:hypothetical protein